MDCFKRLIKKVDVFSYARFLRFRGEDEYSTATGGCCSLMVIVIILLLFFTVGLRTIRKEIITSSVSSSEEADPSLETFTLGPGGDFMFFVGMVRFNLSMLT